MNQQPDPSSWINTMKYLDEQASMGRFEGKAPALTVLRYMVTHAWRKIPNNERAPIGAVMSGKSGIDRMAAETALSRSTVKRAVAWLTDNSWIHKKRMYSKKGQDWNQYTLLLDQTGHALREEMYEVESLKEVRVRENLTRGSERTSPGVHSDPP